MTFNKSYGSIVALGIIHKDGKFLVIKTWMEWKEMNMIKWKWVNNSALNEIGDEFKLGEKKKNLKQLNNERKYIWKSS